MTKVQKKIKLFITKFIIQCVQGRKKGNFQGGARSANFGGSGGIFSNMAPHKSIFRAIEGGRRVCQGGAPDHFGMPGGGRAPPRPPSFCASGTFTVIILKQHIYAIKKTWRTMELSQTPVNIS